MVFTVTITEITQGRPRHVATVQATDEQEAINTACTQLWGGLAFWQRDAGRPQYGQVFRHRRVRVGDGGGFRDDGADSITVQAHIDVSER
jgi:hypothetical protein